MVGCLAWALFFLVLPPFFGIFQGNPAGPFPKPDLEATWEQHGRNTRRIPQKGTWDFSKIPEDLKSGKPTLLIFMRSRDFALFFLFFSLSLAFSTATRPGLTWEQPGGNMGETRDAPPQKWEWDFSKILENLKSGRRILLIFMRSRDFPLSL
jgi:hypothetical protein